MPKPYENHPGLFAGYALAADTENKRGVWNPNLPPGLRPDEIRDIQAIQKYRGELDASADEMERAVADETAARNKKPRNNAEIQRMTSKRLALIREQNGINKRIQEIEARYRKRTQELYQEKRAVLANPRSPGGDSRIKEIDAEIDRIQTILTHNSKPTPSTSPPSQNQLERICTAAANTSRILQGGFSSPEDMRRTLNLLREVTRWRKECERLRNLR